MTAHITRADRRSVWQIWREHWTVIAIAAFLAALAPVGGDIALVAGSSPFARVLLVTMVGLSGALCADKAGLSVSATRLNHAVLIPLAVAAAVAAWVVLLDCFLFREILPEHYVSIFRQIPLGTRLFLFMSRAFMENGLYRLCLMSLLVCLLGQLWRTETGRPANAAYWTAMIVAQLVNIGFNVVFRSASVSPYSVFYDVLRYIVPGVVWGYLYWRHGFATAEIASVGAHPFLQPPLGYFLG